MWIYVVYLIAFGFNLCSALDNGLSRTPPMGWMTWERFRCNTDCKDDPENCISEHLMMDQAKEMVDQGFLAAGYEYIIVDDCWLDHKRDPITGKLRPNPKSFPSGMKALGEYVHGLGLKYGIYEDYGNFTCGGYPGVLGNEELDANTLAEWGADYIKLDGCWCDPNSMDDGYPAFGKILNETGRPMVYSCSWPAYQTDHMVPDYKSIAKHCNLWRNWDDIQDSWTSVLSIIDWFAEHQDEFQQFAGPGNWNDPDMLIIGNFGLSYDQSRTQMALWAIMAAPLIMSTDLRTIRQEFKDILLNQDVIKINQDPLGIQGRRVKQIKKVDIFVRPIMPTFNGSMSAAVALMYRSDDGTPIKVTFTPRSIGLIHSGGYIVKEVFESSNMGSVLPDTEIEVKVNPSGGVQLLRLDVKAKYKPIYPKRVNSKKNNRINTLDLGRTGWKDEIFQIQNSFSFTWY